MSPLPENEVHVWVAKVDDFDFTELLSTTGSWLTNAERSRLDRFYFAEHKTQLLLGRYLMRNVLSRYESLRPEQWLFCYNEYGKPELSKPQQDQLSAPLYFNLSHSRGAIVFAVSRLESIGIDIECNTRSRRVEKIASRYFSESELTDLLALDTSGWQSRFYELWSLKEAYIKACGMGLAIDLSHFSFSFPTPHGLEIAFANQRADDPNYWQFWQLDALQEFNLALAAKSISGRQIQTLKQFVLKAETTNELPVKIVRRG